MSDWQLNLDLPESRQPFDSDPDRWRPVRWWPGVGRACAWAHPRLPGVTVRHCCHPTANRPYEVAGLDIPRCFSLLAHAQEAALVAGGLMPAAAMHPKNPYRYDLARSTT